MEAPNEDWERRVAETWAAIDEHDPDDFRARVDALAAELPERSAIGLFERACAFDSTGHPDEAVPRYRAARAAGLTGLRRRRSSVQLASSLRNLGELDEARAILEAELAAGSDDLDDAVRAFLALVLVDLGRPREAASIALAALAPHLPRYQASLGRYAAALVEPATPEDR